jgi:hypothetical protein
MRPSTSHSYSIRPEFLLAYFRRREAGSARRWALIHARDEKHRNLNCEYGFRNQDGSIPIGCMTHTNADYKTHYDAIETNFRPLYELVSVEEARADHDDGMTIFEFLVLHDIGPKEERLLKDAASRNEDVDYIDLRATSEVRRYADKPPREVVAMLAHLSSYSGLHCRRFFGIRLWDIRSRLVISAYQNRYRHRLRQAAQTISEPAVGGAATH